MKTKSDNLRNTSVRRRLSVSVVRSKNHSDCYHAPLERTQHSTSLAYRAYLYTRLSVAKRRRRKKRKSGDDIKETSSAVIVKRFQQTEVKESYVPFY